MSSQATRRTAGLFDIRVIIGSLLALYGIILTLLGLFAVSDADLDRGDGLNINLWAGLGMLVVGIGFVVVGTPAADRRAGLTRRSRPRTTDEGQAEQVSEHPWQIDALDLEAYLDRVDVAAGEHPNREALDELHEAHVRTFTFDNIDVLLGTHPGVTLDAVQAKFVTRGRGGYCFEHGTLFAAVLERLGYDVRRLLGRVGPPTASPRTHCVVEVSLDGERLLADPGFGMSVHAPDPVAGRRRGRPPRLALPGATRRSFRGRYGVGAPSPARAGLGADAHHRRAAGAARRRDDGAPLHEHLPDVALQAGTDAVSGTVTAGTRRCRPTP